MALAYGSAALPSARVLASQSALTPPRIDSWSAERSLLKSLKRTRRRFAGSVRLSG